MSEINNEPAALVAEDSPHARAVMAGFFEGSRLAFVRWCPVGTSWKVYDSFRDEAWEKSDSRRQILDPANTVGEAISRSMGTHWAAAAESAATSPRVPADVAEVLAKARMECAQKYLYSYWFSFKETGCGAIDEILSWIARAGKSYHSTEQWNDAEDGDPSKIDLIQSAANDAAKIINTLADTLARVAVELSRKQAAYEAVGFELVETRDKLNTAIARAEQAEKRAAEWEKEWQEKGFLLALARDEHSADLLVAAEMEGTLRGEIETLEQRLGNILARIHGDGGHYMGKHGVEKACEDADAIICERLTERDTLRARAEAAERERDEWSSSYTRLYGDLSREQDKSLQRLNDLRDKNYELQTWQQRAISAENERDVLRAEVAAAQSTINLMTGQLNTDRRFAADYATERDAARVEIEKIRSVEALIACSASQLTLDEMTREQIVDGDFECAYDTLVNNFRTIRRVLAPAQEGGAE